MSKIDINALIEEGAICPNCGEGTQFYPDVENCSCHINPPCSAHTDNRLRCDACDWEEPDTDYVALSQVESAIWEKWERERQEARARGYTLPGGGRIFEIDIDGRSGSTMVFTGRYEGPVTAKEIFERLGDGTFGHRGPTIMPARDFLTGPELPHGRFSYTKITD